MAKKRKRVVKKVSNSRSRTGRGKGKSTPNGTKRKVNHSTKFPPGVSGNPNGRPKGSKNKFSIAELQQAIQNVEKKKRISFMESWIIASLGDANAMSNIMNYMLPKKRAIEGFVGVSPFDMPDDVAQAIQDKLRERMEG